MIHFKNNNDAFSLIEALLAIAIVGIVLTPLFILQGTLLRSISRLSFQIHRIYEGETFLLEMQLHEEQKKEKKIDDPETTILYERLPFRKAEKDMFRDMYLERVTMNWFEDRNKRTDAIAMLLFEPEQKNE